MALSVSTAFVTLYDAELRQAYQAARSLAGLTRERSVEGTTVKFNVLGTGQATVRTPQTDVTPLNLTYSQVTATMTDYIAAEYSDIFQQSHINFQERNELAQSVGNAIGRRMDQVVIDAFDAASSPGTVANTIAESGAAGSASDLNTGKIRAAKKVLDAANVPPDNRTLLIHTNNLSALLGQTTVQSSDYNTIRALVDGSLGTWLGFNIVSIGDRDEGSLTKDGSNDRSCYAFHKECMGMGISMNQTSRIDYIPEKTSWLVASQFGAGAVSIQDSGIVKITCREA